LFKKFCSNEINSNLAESIRHRTIKKRDMKTYTAIYSTKFIKNIQYSFQAENMKAAKMFAKYKFSAKRVKIIENETL
jgi:hypothetical protein